MKLLRTIDNGTKVYDCNIRDYFGDKVQIWYNEITNHYRLMSKYKDYNKRRKALDSAGCKHVIIPKCGEVIDITYKTLSKLDQLFGESTHTQFQLWD